ncbi:MAG: hypothetical protein V4517_23785, partial [Pseudomonadota bacterium]
MTPEAGSTGLEKMRSEQACATFQRQISAGCARVITRPRRGKFQGRARVGPQLRQINPSGKISLFQKGETP